MSNPTPVIVEDALPADLPALAVIQRLAFAPSAITRHIFGSVSDTDMDANSLERMQQCVGPHRGLRRLVKAVRGDEVLGFALFTAPDVRELVPEGKSEGGAVKVTAPTAKKYPPGTNEALAESLFEGSRWQDMAKEHWYLSLLFTDPRYQRSGAGTALLKWACDQAERAGLNTYLKATEEGMSLYKRFGFVAGPPTVVKAGEEDLVMTPMRRTPAISILPATEADVPAIATLHLRAFAEDEMYAAIYKDVKPDVLQAFMEDRIRTFALRGKTAWLKAVKGDTILGHVMWSLPEKEGEEIKVGVAADEPDSATMPFPEGTDVETAEHYFAQFDEFNKTIKEACYSIFFISVDPVARGMGCGRVLLSWGLRRADHDQLPIFLFSTSKGLPMYTRSRFASDGEPIYSKDRSFSSLPVVRRPAPIS